MKFRRIIVCVALLILILYTLMLHINAYIDSQEPDYIVLTHKLAHESSNKMAIKHGMQIIGSGGAMMQCVEEVDVRYSINRLLNKEEARKIMVDVIDDLSNTLNNDQKIRPNLIEFPFPESRLSVIIFVEHSAQTKLLHSFLDAIHFHHGKIFYTTSESKYPHKEVMEESELLFEAKKITQAHE